MALTKATYSMIDSAPFSVLDYGAVLSTSIDSSAAFQSAIDAAYDSGGGVVFFPAGTYYLNDTVRLKDNIVLMGYGATILLGPWLATAGGQKSAFGTYSGSTYTTPSVPTATENVFVYGLTIDGQTTGISGQSIPNANMQGNIFVFGARGDSIPSSPTYWQTIQFNNYVVQDCYLKNFAGCGIISYNGNNATITNNRFENFFSNVALSSGSSIAIQGTCGVIIDSNRHIHTASGYSWHGFTILDWDQGCKDIVCTSNFIKDMNQGDGISCESNGTPNIDGGVFDGNVIENCVGDGIHVQGCIEVIISNNVIRGTETEGATIYATNTTSLIITGNVITGGGQGIWSNGGVLRCLIDSNKIMGCKYVDSNYQGTAIFIYDAAPSSAAAVQISNNYIKDVDGNGVYSVIPALISNNFVYNFGRSAVATQNQGIAANGDVSNNSVVGLSPYGSYGVLVGDGVTAQYNSVSGTFANGKYGFSYRKGFGSTGYYNYSRLNCDEVTQNITIWASSAPASGVWAVGDVTYNTTPTSGGSIGWVCTAGGPSATWKTFGAIS